MSIDDRIYHLYDADGWRGHFATLETAKEFADIAHGWVVNIEDEDNVYAYVAPGVDPS